MQGSSISKRPHWKRPRRLTEGPGSLLSSWLCFKPHPFPPAAQLRCLLSPKQDLPPPPRLPGARRWPQRGSQNCLSQPGTASTTPSPSPRRPLSPRRALRTRTPQPSHSPGPDRRSEPGKGHGGRAGSPAPPPRWRPSRAPSPGLTACRRRRPPPRLPQPRARTGRRRTPPRPPSPPPHRASVGRRSGAGVPLSRDPERQHGPARPGPQRPRAQPAGSRQAQGGGPRTAATAAAAACGACAAPGPPGGGSEPRQPSASRRPR